VALATGQRRCPNCYAPLRPTEDECGFPPHSLEALDRLADALRVEDFRWRWRVGHLPWGDLHDAEKERWRALAEIARKELLPDE
jgi:hypothetical protein